MEKKKSVDFALQLRESLYEALTPFMEAETKRTPTVQGCLEVCATFGYAAAAVWKGFVPPGGLDDGGEEAFIKLMRRAYQEAHFASEEPS